jgi:hypothetical protein
VFSGESGRPQSALPGAFFWANSGLEFMSEFYPIKPNEASAMAASALFYRVGLSRQNGRK